MTVKKKLTLAHFWCLRAFPHCKQRSRLPNTGTSSGANPLACSLDNMRTSASLNRFCLFRRSQWSGPQRWPHSLRIAVCEIGFGFLRHLEKAHSLFLLRFLGTQNRAMQRSIVENICFFVVHVSADARSNARLQRICGKKTLKRRAGQRLLVATDLWYLRTVLVQREKRAKDMFIVANRHKVLTRILVANATPLNRAVCVDGEQRKRAGHCFRKAHHVVAAFWRQTPLLVQHLASVAHADVAEKPRLLKESNDAVQEIVDRVHRAKRVHHVAHALKCHAVVVRIAEHALQTAPVAE